MTKINIFKKIIEKVLMILIKEKNKETFTVIDLTKNEDVSELEERKRK